MKTTHAPKHVKDAVHLIIVGNMAARLVAEQIDLQDVTAVQAALLAAGFGEASISNLTNRAIAAAREALATGAPPNDHENDH